MFVWMVLILSWVVIGDIWGLSMEWKNLMLWKVEMKSGKNEYEFVRVCEQINRNM